MRTKVIVILFIFLFAQPVFSAITYPYSNFTLTSPGSDAPYSGFGNNFASLGSGIRTVLWNPAGLAKIKVSEAYLGVTTAPDPSNSNKAYTIQDQNVSITGGSSTTSTNYLNKIIFTSDLTDTKVTTREFTAPLIYSGKSSGMDFKQAIKITDWLAFGISSRGNTNVDAAISGNFPAQYLTELDLYNTSNFLNSGISVKQDGKLTYTYSSTGFGNYTYTSEASAWTGFLGQTQRIPFTISTELRNNMDIQQNLTFTSAAKWGKLSYGVNFTPISASFNVDNTAKAIVNNNTADVYFYTPNFNPSIESDVIQWMNDPNQYGGVNGYKKSYIKVPAGESIGEAKYTGFYKASAVRADFGIMYDFSDAFTFGAALENISGAGLNFTGVGRVAYVNSRINTSESVSIIDPSSSSGWDLFSDTYNPVEGTENIGMLPSMNFDLPRRAKVGVTIRRPILITLDYETQNNPMIYRYKKADGDYATAILNNVRIIRGGLESQILFLPVIFRGSTSILWKPDAQGLDAQAQTEYNKYFFLLNRFLPLTLDLGIGTNMWNAKIDASLGVDASSVLSMAQLDTLNISLGKILYTTFTVEKDNWNISFQNNLDPISSASAYQGMSQADRDSNDWTKYMNILKWVSTLTIGFKF